MKKSEEKLSPCEFKLIAQERKEENRLHCVVAKSEKKTSLKDFYRARDQLAVKKQKIIKLKIMKVLLA